MRIVLDIAIALIVAGIFVSLISYIINVLLRFISLDVPIIKLALFLCAWYFVGPIIYKYLIENIVETQSTIIEFIYKPIQILIEIIKI